MSEKTFRSAMVDLHRSLQLDTSTLRLDADVYALQVGALEIELAGNQPGYVNMLCFPGCLTKPSMAALQVLLAANRFQEQHPPLTVSLMEGPEYQVVVWGRLPLSEASAQAMDSLFVRLTETAHATRQWLEAGAPGLPAGRESTGPQGADSRVRKPGKASGLVNRGLLR